MTVSFSELVSLPATELRGRVRQCVAERVHAMSQEVSTAHIHPETDSGTKHMMETASLPSFMGLGALEAEFGDLIASVAAAFRHLLGSLDASAFWEACRASPNARELSEEVGMYLAAIIWQERASSPLTDEQWLQSLPARMTPDLQRKVQEMREATSRRRSPITSEALSKQLAAFRKIRETRFA